MNGRNDQYRNEHDPDKISITFDMASDMIVNGQRERNQR